MKRFTRNKKYVFLMIILTLVVSCETIKPSVDNPVEGWAVLPEKNYYEDPDMPDIPVDYINTTLIRQALEDSDWNPVQIHDLREFTQETLQAELDWLAEIADENDIVILYVTCHGNYLRKQVLWREFFADNWSQIPSQRRVLIVATSKAAGYINYVINDSSPHLSIASTAEKEYGWSGLEEEGLPIIGNVFTHYFADALNNSNADADGDGLVSIQEATQMAEEQQRAYMHDVIFVVPEIVEMYHTQTWPTPEQDPTYPNVIVDDAIGEPLYLALDVYL